MTRGCQLFCVTQILEIFFQMQYYSTAKGDRHEYIPYLRFLCASDLACSLQPAIGIPCNRTSCYRNSITGTIVSPISRKPDPCYRNPKAPGAPYRNSGCQWVWRIL